MTEPTDLLTLAELDSNAKLWSERAAELRMMIDGGINENGFDAEKHRALTERYHRAVCQMVYYYGEARRRREQG